MAAENRGLLKALQAVASGSLQVAEFTPIVLSKALDELLFQISKDYDIDYKELSDRYKKPIIDKHAMMMPVEEPRCKALTKRTKKACTRFAVLNGYCSAHAEEMRKEIEANAEYVGPSFAEEARKIHYGETETKAIYGEASDAEAEALRDEGIDFARIPWLPPTN